MKKGFKLALCGLGLFALAGFGVGLSLLNEAKVNEPAIVLAEGEEPETPETLPCQVVIDPVKHGSITTDISEGNVGDICTITAKHDFLYKVSYVAVNGVNLIESETTIGEFSFALAEGENKITASFVVDEELCGELSNIVKQASEKDWTNLFTVENVLVLVKWVLDGGVLIAIISYYVKDKRLERKLENTVKGTMARIIPETTKETVLAAFNTLIEPTISALKADNIDIKRALAVFSKCFALGQENTPESRRAILDELSGLKIGDLESINEIKKQLEESLQNYAKAYEETLNRIKAISENNTVVETKEVEAKVEETEVKTEEVINIKQPTE